MFWSLLTLLHDPHEVTVNTGPVVSIYECKPSYIVRGSVQEVGAVSYTHLTLPTNREV